MWTLSAGEEEFAAVAYIVPTALREPAKLPLDAEAITTDAQRPHEFYIVLGGVEKLNILLYGSKEIHYFEIKR